MRRMRKNEANNKKSNQIWLIGRNASAIESMFCIHDIVAKTIASLFLCPYGY